MSTVTVSTEISCPDCGKRMAKKNWKDHARNKHTMTEETIQKKYEQLQPPSISCSAHDKPKAIIINNFFSSKKFATATASNSEQENLNDNVSNRETVSINNSIDTHDTSSKGNINCSNL
jgi:hypothetical protein